MMPPRAAQFSRSKQGREYLTTTIQAYDQLAPEYANKWFDDPVMEATIRKFAKASGSGARVLDVGCGPGRDVKFMSELGMEAVGADLSEGMIEEARHRFPAGIFRWMDMRNLRFPPRAFSGVWSCASIHHLTKDQAAAALAEFSRVLVEDGLLAVSIEVGEHERERYDRIGRFERLYKAPEFRSLLVRTGFEIVDEQTSCNQKTTLEDSTPKQWLYFLARKTANFSINANPEDCACPLCPENRFDFAARAGLPGPGSIITGDDWFYLAPDIAPMMDGHLLLVSCEHIVSFGGLPPDFDDAIAKYTGFVSRLFESTYGAAPVFFEHGGGSNGDAGACIDHAHWHCVPGSADIITSMVEARFGKGNPADVDALRSLRSNNRNYLYVRYASGEGRAFPVEMVPSQFFRQVLAATTNEEAWRWRSTLTTAASVTRHRTIRERLIPAADALLMKPEGGSIE